MRVAAEGGCGKVVLETLFSDKFLLSALGAEFKDACVSMLGHFSEPKMCHK